MEYQGHHHQKFVMAGSYEDDDEDDDGVDIFQRLDAEYLSSPWNLKIDVSKDVKQILSMAFKPKRDDYYYNNNNENVETPSARADTGAEKSAAEFESKIKSETESKSESETESNAGSETESTTKSRRGSKTESVGGDSESSWQCREEIRIGSDKTVAFLGSTSLGHRNLCTAILEYTLIANEVEIQNCYPVFKEERERVVDVDLSLILSLNANTPSFESDEADGYTVPIHVITQCMPNLIRLNLSCIMDDHMLELIAIHLPGLVHLAMRDCNEVTSLGYGHLAGRRRTLDSSTFTSRACLLSLKMEKCANAQDVDVQELVLAHPKLQRLTVEGTVYVSAEGLQHIGRLVDMEKLQFLPLHSYLDERNMRDISGLANLLTLKLRLNRHCLPTQKGFPLFSQLRHLRKLVLQNWCFTDPQFFFDLGTLRCLRLFSVGGCGVNDACLKSFGAAASKVEHLSLNCCDGIGDDGLRHLIHLPMLKNLVLSKCSNLRGKSLLFVVQNSFKLTALNLTGCSGLLNRPGLVRLANIKLLTVIGMPTFRSAICPPDTSRYRYRT